MAYAALVFKTCLPDLCKDKKICKLNNYRYFALVDSHTDSYVTK